MPRVSIILTGYNQARFLRTAVDSALNQSYSDFELLLVDNGSTDGSHEIIREYEDDPRVRTFIFDENRSLSGRFNHAISASRGEFITFLYGDDWYLRHKLETQVANFERLPPRYGVVYGLALGVNELTGARYAHRSLRRSGDVFPDLMLRAAETQIDMLTPMTRRSCFLEHPFDEAIFAETEAIYLRIALTHWFAFIDESVVVLRDHHLNAGKALRRNLEQLQLSLANLRADRALTPERAHLVDRYEGTILRTRGWSGARVGADPSWARECLVGAVKVSPRQAIHPKTAGGLVLSALPSRWRASLNRLGHRVRRSTTNPIYVEDYIED